MRSLIKSQYVFLNIIWPLIFVLTVVVSFNLKYNLVGLTFVLLTAQSLICLSSTLSRSVNLLSIFFVFTLTFLNILPWLHYSENHLLWRSFPILESTYIVTNAIILLANSVVFVVYMFVFKKNKPMLQSVLAVKNNRSALLILLFFSGLGFTLLLYINDFSIQQLLFRGLEDEKRLVVVESSSLAALLGMAARLIPVFCFFYAITRLDRGGVIKLILFFLMFVSVFPTGVARYMAAFVYIPFLLIYFPVMRNASLFSATLLFSLLFIFPFLNQFRYFSGVESLHFLPSVDFFYAGHFDAYENFASAVESDFITYGYQILGSLFFFIPRFIWPNKPVGSGYEMAEKLGYSFNNISMPFLGEGFVNFGFAGVLLFSILIGYSMAKLDSAFYFSVGAKYKVNYPFVIYYFMIGALFFVLRGDLLSSVAYVVAGLSIAFLLERTMKLFNTIGFWF